MNNDKKQYDNNEKQSETNQRPVEKQKEQGADIDETAEREEEYKDFNDQAKPASAKREKDEG